MSIATSLLTDAAAGRGALASTTLDRRACDAKRLTLRGVGHLFAMPNRPLRGAIARAPSSALIEGNCQSPHPSAPSRRSAGVRAGSLQRRRRGR
eukprot:3253847-Pyramimonas_sp.AAC.1